MLVSLYLKNYIIIDELEISFCDGFNIITGETGAGKSIVLEGLLLSMCAKQSTKGIHKYSDQPAILTSTFSVLKNQNVKDLLNSCDIELQDESELIIRRVIHPDGKSKSYINNQPVTASFLKSVGDELIEYTGQHSNFKLLNAHKHIELFDDFALTEGIKRELNGYYQNYHALKKELHALSASKEGAIIEKQYLEDSIAEIEAIDTYETEETELLEKRKVIQDKQKLIDATNKITDICDGVNFSAKFAQIQKELFKFDEYFAEAIKAIDASFTEFEEFQTQLHNVIRSFGSDTDIEKLDDRLFKIRATARKYNVPPISLASLLEELRGKLAKLATIEADISALEKRFIEAKEIYAKLAIKISAIRAREAEHLTAMIKDTLSYLKMERADFAVQITAAEDENHWSADGIDNVKFVAKTNTGSSFGDIAKIASGGELSRIMLALKLALASKALSITLIFDEADAGLSGATANSVGKKLSDLSKKYQILCITHQPQVASYSDRHFFVEKVANDDYTELSIRALEQEDKIISIAKMISGDVVTPESMEAARVLMKQN